MFLPFCSYIKYFLVCDREKDNYGCILFYFNGSWFILFQVLFCFSSQESFRHHLKMFIQCMCLITIRSYDPSLPAFFLFYLNYLASMSKLKHHLFLKVLPNKSSDVLRSSVLVKITFYQICQNKRLVWKFILHSQKTSLRISQIYWHKGSMAMRPTHVPISVL